MVLWLKRLYLSLNICCLPLQEDNQVEDSMKKDYTTLMINTQSSSP